MAGTGAPSLSRPDSHRPAGDDDAAGSRAGGLPHHSQPPLGSGHAITVPERIVS